MPISKAYVKSLVNRLCSLPGQKGQSDMFDSPDEAKRIIRGEIGRAIEKFAQSDADADRIVESLMRGKFRPVPSEIEETAKATSSAEWPPKWKPMTGCPLGRCDGSGWLTVEAGELSGATPCGCRTNCNKAMA